MSENQPNTADIQKVIEKKIATINTVQHSVYVARLAIPRYRNYNWYIPYDADNLYPNKIKTIAERSVTTSSAIRTHADFLSGQGFGELLNEIVVNEEGQTLEEILKREAINAAEFNGIALHFNYNRMGVIVEINEVPFEGLRWNHDMSRMYYADEWDKVASRSREVFEYNMFNPENAINEINKVGIDKYNGQILYVIPNKRDIYTVCRFDAAINDAQFEDEATIGRLRGMQNDYPLGGIMKLPSPLFDDENFADTMTDLKSNQKGQKNANSWMLIPVTNEEVFKGKLFEPNVRQNIDRLTENQENRAEKNIYKTYQQPLILNGVSSDGMFNQDQFVDAFDYYNSKTDDERNFLEKAFNRFWPYTQWSKGEILEIIPKEYISTRKNEEAPDGTI